MVDYSELQMREIISMIQDTFPNAQPALIMRIANDGLKKAGNKYRLAIKRKTINSVEDQALYDISDLGGGAGVSKIQGVAYMNSDGEHVRIKRLIGRVKLAEGA